MSNFTFIARGFCPSIWWFFYVHSKSRVNFIRQVCTLIYMWITSKNEGYVGRTTIIESLSDLPHGFHGVHISRDAHIGKQCVIYQNVTIGGGWSALYRQQCFYWCRCNINMRNYFR